MKTSESGTERGTGAADGLAIFDDVREVPSEPAVVVGLQLVVVVLGYSVAIGLVVLVAVVLILTMALFWPVLVDAYLPQLAPLLTPGG